MNRRSIHNAANLSTETVRGRASDFIENIPSMTDSMAGKGIVTCAGGIRYNTCAWVLIKLTRHVGCDLPIEVWCLGESEYDEDWVRLVEPLGVRCVQANMPEAHHHHPRYSGWSLKSRAMLGSRFAEVLFLDADNVPVRDPTYLFDELPYRHAGSVFWPDGAQMLEDKSAWHVFDVPYRAEREFESGQMLIDKHRCWRALHLANWYNENAQFFYQHVYGDKDTFRFAWHRLEQPFAMPNRNLENLHGTTLCQHDFDGRRIFQHRCFDKWSLRGNRRNPGFLFEQECLEFVRELKANWNPLRRFAERWTAEDHTALDHHAGRRFRYFRDGRRQGRITLGSNHVLHTPTDSSDDSWWFEDGTLVLSLDHDAFRCELNPVAHDTWRSSDMANVKVKLLPV